MTRLSFETRSAIYLGAAIVGWIAGGVVAMLLWGCAHAPALPDKPLKVTIVSMPEMAQCYLADAPEPPAKIDLDFDDNDVIRRTTVNIRQYNDFIDWATQMAVWVDSVNACIVAVTQKP